MSSANDYANFIRIDDDNQEHKVIVKEEDEGLTLSGLMRTLDIEIDYLEKESYRYSMTSTDLLRTLLLMRELFRKVTHHLETSAKTEQPQ